MGITELSIKKPVFAWMIMTAFIIFGSLSFNRLGISEKPDVDNPVVNISVNWDGAAPEVIELDVIDQLESSLLSVEGIKSMSSRARRGRADITLEFGLDKNVDIAVQEVQSILGQAQRRLPEDIEAPVVRKSNPEDRPILWLSLTSSKFTKKELMVFVRDQIKDRFQTIEGVAEVILGGYVDPALRVWVNQERLNNYDLSVNDIVGAINKEHTEYPAGIFENAKTEYNIRTLGEASTPNDFSKIVINQRGGAPNFNPIFLSQVADIEDNLEDQRRISRVMGNMSIGLGFRKQRGTNAVEVAQKIKAKMEELQKILPSGAEMGVNYDGTVFIEDSIEELKFTLILAGIMTSLVVWFFLGSFGAAFNIMLSIPTAIIATFMALEVFGFTLNTFTMLGLTLAVGLVVDDNIMVLENISRLHKSGMNKIKASLLGTREITFAALASSLAIIAIFLPLGFVSGVVGRYFYEFAITICGAICFSYIDAITLTPMRTSYLLGKDLKEGKRYIDKFLDKAENKYKVSLSWCLNHRLIVISIAVLVTISSVFLAQSIKREFTPAQDQSRLILFIKTKAGSSLEFTEKKVRLVEKILMQQEELKRYFVAIGGFTGVESNTAFSYVTIQPIDVRPMNKELGKVLTQQEFANYLRGKFKEQIKGALIFIRDPSLGGFGTGSSYPIEFSLSGANYNDLIAEKANVEKLMKDSKLMVEVDSDYQGKIPELQIIPDREKAKLRGVSVDDIGRTIQSMISGITAGKFSKGGRRYNIVVKIKDQDLQEIKDISEIKVRNNRGELIPLSDVTKIVEDKGLLSINRKDRTRSITMTSNLNSGVAQGDALEYLRENIKPKLRKGVSLVESGSVQTYNESFSSLIYVIILGLVIAYMVLASQFNSFLHPITILSVLPFSFSGAFITLKIADQSINIYSMIGLILLMGIVKKNSIILVDFTNQMRDEGKSVTEALMQACPIRLRPIIMTSVSTIAGTLPAALALGPGAETRVPMALSVIGGLLLATILTLFIVPCVYSLIPGKVDQDRKEI